MCTALSMKSEVGNIFFGRTMDIPFSFNESLMIIPRQYKYKDNVTGKTINTKQAIIGIGTIINNHPGMADGMNEYGLGCTCLYFPGFAHFEEELSLDKINIAAYDFLLWVLSTYKSVNDVLKSIDKIELVNTPIDNNTPVSPLHWMIVDKTGASIVIEKTKSNFTIYNNPIGVMTNSPCFYDHLLSLTSTTQCNEPSSILRFKKLAFFNLKLSPLENSLNTLSQFFHMLDTVSIIKGMESNFTSYTSCMNLNTGLYYYKTYENNRITGVSIRNYNLNGKTILIFPLCRAEDIYLPKEKGRN